MWSGGTETRTAARWGWLAHLGAESDVIGLCLLSRTRPHWPRLCDTLQYTIVLFYTTLLYSNVLLSLVIELVFTHTHTHNNTTTGVLAPCAQPHVLARREREISSSADDSFGRRAIVMESLDEGSEPVAMRDHHTEPCFRAPRQ